MDECSFKLFRRTCLQSPSLRFFLYNFNIPILIFRFKKVSMDSVNFNNKYQRGARYTTYHHHHHHHHQGHGRRMWYCGPLYYQYLSEPTGTLFAHSKTLIPLPNTNVENLICLFQGKIYIENMTISSNKN